MEQDQRRRGVLTSVSTASADSSPRAMSCSRSSQEFESSIEEEKGRAKGSFAHLEQAPADDGNYLPSEHYTRYPNRWSRVR